MSWSCFLKIFLRFFGIQFSRFNVYLATLKKWKGIDVDACIHQQLFFIFSWGIWCLSVTEHRMMRGARSQLGLSGLEPPTSRLSGVRSNRLSYKPVRTEQGPRLPNCDCKLACYIACLEGLGLISPFNWSGIHLLSHIVSNAVPSAV